MDQEGNNIIENDSSEYEPDPDKKSVLFDAYIEINISLKKIKEATSVEVG